MRTDESGGSNSTMTAIEMALYRPHNYANIPASRTDANDRKSLVIPGQIG
jgi:hypothetical protein